MTDGMKPVSIDPKTGFKVFDTRADKASEMIRGKGYSVVQDRTLTELPPERRDVTFDAQAAAKYRANKEARLGADNFTPMVGQFAKYREDPYSATPVEREALADECDLLVVGAGLAGLLLWYRLNQAGLSDMDVRFCEQGGDVGGTWYWNRYPGIACDIEAYTYMPLLDEMGYIPSMKFASGFEIFEYCQSVAARYGFYEHCLFHTTVDQTVWDEDAGRWTVCTNRGDAIKARYVVLANGILNSPKLPVINGMETFKGEAIHTARWNYDIELEGKVVGIIGTGSTAVQVVPELAKVVKELYVFQRTPSTVDIRNQRATTDEERRTWSQEPGWAAARRARFARIDAGRSAVLADDDYLAGKLADFKKRKVHKGDITPEELMQKQIDANYRVMEQIRARVGAIVKDPKTAEALKPYYPLGCKRPTFSDEFLPTFNLPHVHLIDTSPDGVTSINERGVVHDGFEYPLDVLIYATGFQWMATSTFNRVIGREGRTLTEKWEEEGVKTFLGLHSRGFPNLFVITGPQGGGGSFNFIIAIEAHADYIVWALSKMRELGECIIDVDESAEEDYAKHCRESDVALKPLRDCLSYYNGYGRAAPGSLGYSGGIWPKLCAEAQNTLAPYVFGHAAPEQPEHRNPATTGPVSPKEGHQE